MDTLVRSLVSLVLGSMLLGAITFSAPVRAGPSKIEVCHHVVDGSQKALNWKLLNVGSSLAVEDHLAHGDALPGLELSNMSGFALNGDCAIVETQETVPYVCFGEATDFHTLYVRLDLQGTETGEIGQPFRSFSSALAYAKMQGVPAVELQVAPGSYPPEELTISRHTRIVGPGNDVADKVMIAASIVNSGPFSIGIQGIQFNDHGIDPAITVANPSAETALCDAHFLGVTGHAVAQSGGNIRADVLRVNSTSRDAFAPADDLLSGSAIVMTGGVQATLAKIELINNEGTGLIASGAGTSVNIAETGLNIDLDGNVSPDIAGNQGCYGGVLVNMGASLSAMRLTIDNNVNFGVLVRDVNTSVDLPHLIVTFTRKASDITFCGFDVVSSLAVFDGPTVTIRGTENEPFLLSDSALVGIRIQGSGVPLLDLANGIVSNNPIGVSLSVASDSVQMIVDQLQDNILYINNGINLDASALPIPVPDI